VKEFSSIKDFYDYLVTNSTWELDIDNLPEDYKNFYKFFEFYKKIKEKIVKELNKYNNSLLVLEENKIIRELLDYFTNLNRDGKCLRGVLIALAYLDVKNDDDYLPLVVAYETFQTSILVHDDIIDNDNYRRGKKTIPYCYYEKYNEVEDKDNLKLVANSLGICMGDLGFYLANKIIYKNYYNSLYLRDLLDCYNEIVINTIRGEVLDVELPFKARTQEYQTKEDDVWEIYKLKTAYYTITGPFELGLVLSGRSLSSNIKLALNNLGIAFQIKDDILGVYGKSSKTGKSNSSDIVEFKQTILYTYTVNNSLYKDKLLEYYGKNLLEEKELEEVREIFKVSGAYDYAKAKIEELFKDSRDIINNDKTLSSNTKDIILGFITYLELREK
jgi:geranylgeranyl pyrophosphate synthase